MLVAQPNAFRHQDGQALFAPGKGKQPHPEYRWPQRAPDEHEDYNVRAAWREAEDVNASGHGMYARYHEETGMLLFAKWGFITTVVRVEESEHHADEIVREYKEGMLDG